MNVNTQILRSTFAPQRGIALILVTFVIALATIVVTNLTYSTYIGSRSNSVVERSLYAEYLLKSTVNVAIALIKADLNSNKDGPQDIWARFSQGTAVPPELFGIEIPNLSIELEVSPENQRFPLRHIINGNDPRPLTRDMLVRLFKNLGFDNDTKEVQISGPFANRHFKSDELVANLIDYMDSDSESYKDPDFAKGIEGDLPKDTFENRPPYRVSELAAIPGFTPGRMRKLEPLLTTFDNQGKININFAPPLILSALSDQIGSREIKEILDFRASKDGPFDFGDQKLQNILNDANIYQQINSTVGYNSSWFQVLAKVDFGTKAYFMRAIVVRQGSPTEVAIRSMEIF